MAREARKVIAVNIYTGEKKVYEKGLAASAALGVSNRAVMQALEHNGVCCGWKLYDTPERIKAQIEHLKKMLKVVEKLGSEEAWEEEMALMK